MAHFKSERQVADQVIYEGAVDNVEINEDVIRTYCEVIGIDFDTEKELLWIAEEGMRAPIPKPWKACRDTNSDELYYFNFETGESIWDHPLDEYYSKKVVEERENLRKNNSRNSAGRMREHSNALESLTQPYPVPVSSPSRSQSGLANTLPPNSKVNYGSSSGTMKEDGKRFLKASSKKSSDEEGFGERGEKIMFGLDDDDEQIGLATQLAQNVPQETHAYDDDYEEHVDFGDGDYGNLSEFLLEKESMVEPELANLASTGDHETVTSQYSQGNAPDLGANTNNSAIVTRPANPLADSMRLGQSMTVTSFDASEGANLKHQDPIELEERLNTEYASVKLEIFEEHANKIKQLKAECEENFSKEEKELRNEFNKKIESVKKELQSEVEKEQAMRDDWASKVENEKAKIEESLQKEIEELRRKTAKALETEKQLLEDRENEIQKRVVSVKADIDSEVDRRLGTEKSLLENEFATRVASLRKELAATHEMEMSKLRSQLEETNFKEQEAKRFELQAAEARVSSLRVLETEMGAVLDRRRAELHEEHENTLAQIRRERERQIAAIRQEADFEISKIRSDATDQIDEVRRKVTEETNRQISDATVTGERERAVALARVNGIDENLKLREDRIAKRQRDVDDLDRKLADREHSAKLKQDELKRLADEQLKEETALANQKSLLEKKRLELSGIQRSIAVDEMINQHAPAKPQKEQPQKESEKEADTISVKSSEAADSTNRSFVDKRSKRKKKRNRRHQETSEESSKEEEEEESTIADATLTTSNRKGKPPKLADILPLSSCSSEEDLEGSGLGRHGNKVRRMLLNLLFPGQKKGTEKDNEPSAIESLGENCTIHRSKHRSVSSKLRDPVLLNLNLTDDEDSDVDLQEVRSLIRSEKLRSLQADQRNKLQAAGGRVSPLEDQLYLAQVPFNYRPVYNTQKASIGDIDRYLSSRWYQLYRGSAYSSPMRSRSAWQYPLASTSSYYGYVPASDLLKQYQANKIANSLNLNRASDVQATMESRSTAN